ncbi:replicative DNA helicase [Tepidibacter mesophilus]|uniref:replicative DNA helicase n=1 Tax=Tepidibacter mesophilus TaxID=655607 RepID=UPI000C082348|nr:replicative DNA helicase [Tepidibacter mesophilus]
MKNIDLEQTTLGCFLLDAAAVEEIELLDEEDFTLEIHKQILKAAKELKTEDTAVDINTLYSKIPKMDISYITGLVTCVSSPKNYTSYVKELKKVTRQRKLIQLARKIEDDPSRENLIDEVELDIYNLRESSGVKQIHDSKELMFKVLDEIEERGRIEGIKGLDTGFEKVNEVLDGLQPGYVLIGGRPGMGKTSIALDMARHTAIREKSNVAIFSLEMTKEQILKRMLIQETLIPSEKIYKGKLNSDEWAKVHEAANVIYNSNIHITDDVYTITEIRSKCLKLKRTKGLDLVIIDYLQLVQDGEGNTENEQLASISKRIMQLWKKLECPVIAIAQLSRSCEARADKRPLMSDFRGSGQLEQDTNLAILMYRDEYYNADSKEKGIAEAIIAKNRFGPTGTIKVGFLNEMTRFLDLKKMAWR